MGCHQARTSPRSEHKPRRLRCRRTSDTLIVGTIRRRWGVVLGGVGVVRGVSRSGWFRLARRRRSALAVLNWSIAGDSPGSRKSGTADQASARRPARLSLRSGSRWGHKPAESGQIQPVPTATMETAPCAQRRGRSATNAEVEGLRNRLHTAEVEGSSPPSPTIVMSRDIGNSRTLRFGGFSVFRSVDRCGSGRARASE